jgi:hypothetical protein
VSRYTHHLSHQLAATVRADSAAGVTQTELARRHGVTRRSIYSVLRHRTYRQREWCERCNRYVPELTYTSYAGPVCAACEPECRDNDEALEQEWITQGTICPECRQDWESNSGCSSPERLVHVVMEL